MARGVKAAAAAGPVEGPWALPEGWRWERLGNVASVNPGTQFTSLAAGSPVTFIRMAALTELTGRFDLNEHRPVETVSKGYTRFLSGDVLFAKITPCMENGKLGVVPPLPFGVGAGSTEFHVLRSSEVLHEQFLFYWLSRKVFREEAEFNMTGTAGQRRVPTDFMASAAIPLPQLETQHRIVNRIDTLFAEVAAGEEALAAAKASLGQWRQALLKAAVTGDLTADWRAANPPAETGEALLARILADRRTRWTQDPRNKGKRTPEPPTPDTTDLPTLPEGWTWATVEQIGEVTGGLTKNSKRGELPLKMPYLRVANVYAGELRLDDVEHIGCTEAELPRTLLKPGDLLVVEGNGSIDQIGRSAVWDGQIARCLHQNHLIKVRFAERVMADWVQTWLQSPHGRQEIVNCASSTSGLHTLSISKIEAIRVPVAGLTEMAAALGMIASAGQPAEQIGEFGAVGDLRQSILAAAFRGELAT